MIGIFPGEAKRLTVALLAALLLFLVIMQGARSLAWVALFPIGAALIVYGVLIPCRSRVASRWPRVLATVRSSNIQEVCVLNDGPSIEFQPEVEYMYRVASRDYVSKRLGVTSNSHRSPNRSPVDDAMQAIRPGSQVEVHVCPTRPSFSVLLPRLLPRRLRHHVLCALAGAALLIIASLLSRTGTQ